MNKSTTIQNTHPRVQTKAALETRRLYKLVQKACTGVHREKQTLTLPLPMTGKHELYENHQELIPIQNNTVKEVLGKQARIPLLVDIYARH